MRRLLSGLVRRRDRPGHARSTQLSSTYRYFRTAPEYGGSGGEVGNALVGFEDRHVWQPPYGYYDADYAEKGE